MWGLLLFSFRNVPPLVTKPLVITHRNKHQLVITAATVLTQYAFQVGQVVTLTVSLHVSFVDEGELTVTTLLVTGLALVSLSIQTQHSCA